VRSEESARPVNWEPAGPKALDLWMLYLHKEFRRDCVEIKAGYNTNILEFTGMQVGGSTASGVQNVYVVLPTRWAWRLPEQQPRRTGAGGQP